VVNHILSPLLGLHGAVACLLVALLVFGEAAIFVGFVLPGETAVVIGGVLASQGRVPLPVMLGVVVVAAVVGDSVGYEVGRRAGPRILRLRPLERRREPVERAQRFLRERGGRAVFLGRFTAFLRAVMPGLAGVSQMPYPRFLAFNAVGGAVWGGGFTVVGYLAGASYRRVEHIAGRASLVFLVVVVVALVAVHFVRRRRDRPATGADAEQVPGEDEAGEAAASVAPDR
jgi:membrane-associated protein